MLEAWKNFGSRGDKLLIAAVLAFVNAFIYLVDFVLGCCRNRLPSTRWNSLKCWVLPYHKRGTQCHCRMTFKLYPNTDNQINNSTDSLGPIHRVTTNSHNRKFLKRRGWEEASFYHQCSRCHAEFRDNIPQNCKTVKKLHFVKWTCVPTINYMLQISSLNRFSSRVLHALKTTLPTSRNSNSCTVHSLVMSPKTQLLGIQDQSATGHFGHQHASQYCKPLQVQKAFLVSFQQAFAIHVTVHRDIFL
jgi:hypothetical protein